MEGELDDVANGKLNWVKTIKENLDVALEAISDQLKNSLFRPEDIEKEKYKEI